MSGGANEQLIAASENAPETERTEGVLGRDAAARLAADVFTLALGTVAAVITARWLGPSGKGVAATLAFLAALFGRFASLGLGESAIVVVGRGRVAMATALRANLAAVALSGAAAALVFAGLAIIQIGPESPNLWLAIAATAAAVPLTALHDVISHGLTMEQRIVRASVTVAVVAAATVLGLISFVIVLELDVFGAALGTLFGICAGLLASLAMLSPRLRALPRWNRSYLRDAVPYGLRLEASYLTTLMAGRLDLVLVFSIAGEAAAGNYSIALTIGSIVGLAPFALSFASFPRLAYSDVNSARSLTLRMWRVANVASFAVAVALAGVTPFIVPGVFGSAFESATIPAVVLLAGAVLGGGQWTLARASAARGDSRLLLRSYVLSLITMVGLDLVLIPPFELVGAATASVAGSAAGLAYCVASYLRRGVSSGDLAPRAADGRDLVRVTRELHRMLRPSA